ARVARLLEPGNRGLGIPPSNVRRREAPVAHRIYKRRLLRARDFSAAQAGGNGFGKASELRKRHRVEALTDEPEGAEGIATRVGVALEHADAAYHQLGRSCILAPEIVELSEVTGGDTEQSVVVPGGSDLAGPLGELDAPLRIAEHEMGISQIGAGAPQT